MTPESAYGRPHRRPLRSIPTPTPSRPTLNPYAGDSPMVDSRLYAICRDTRSTFTPCHRPPLGSRVAGSFRVSTLQAGVPSHLSTATGLEYQNNPRACFCLIAHWPRPVAILGLPVSIQALPTTQDRITSRPAFLHVCGPEDPLRCTSSCREERADVSLASRWDW